MYMQICIYSRVSTRDKGQDTENQARQLREFAAAQGWVIVKEYKDTASGKRGDRAAFQEMFAAASRREFDLVLFWSLDRLSREGVLETLQHLQRLTGYGVGYRSFTEQYLDSIGPFKDAVLAILAVIAKQERVRLSERVLAGLQRAKANGRVGGRPKVDVDVKKARAMMKDGTGLRPTAAKLGCSVNTLRRALA